MPAPFQTRRVYRAVSDGLSGETDFIAEETAVALVYNGISHVVLMATPQDLDVLALGFSLSEGILSSPAELYGLETVETCDGIEIQMEIASARFQNLKQRRRNLAGRTGCGLCGIDSLAAAKPRVSPLARSQTIKAADVRAALAELGSRQPIRNQTGASHSAAWVENGKIAAAFEDIGRHNALDKLIGYGAKNGLDWAQGFALVSSRASYEMAAKAAAVGIGCLAAVSAPTALAVRLAEDADMTLIGFANPQRFTVYSGEEWVEAV
ncbi:formate dehydrogenase accessory sulfurtransferase FdhD [Neisseria chenwenguii]|uniref:Sulfur carrier protein FdhD n=1 Tax=Neisseria chenwenguii TaxID=1853278 RepID=A0A220RZ46_9NEIS|nr:formate dehydrogenase accessory sulfurtransferase FdhD [Neisseria chenwenguii]ASK26480.1 sulfurtransferase FdhD [Neisseria chenwenguii]ROV55922.1 formate dehydrogenase accessory sulfurtransferase FdhD [Neisseria chenwenguii]